MQLARVACFKGKVFCLSPNRAVYRVCNWSLQAASRCKLIHSASVKKKVDNLRLHTYTCANIAKSAYVIRSVRISVRTTKIAVFYFHYLKRYRLLWLLQTEIWMFLLHIHLHLTLNIFYVSFHCFILCSVRSDMVKELFYRPWVKNKALIMFFLFIVYRART